MMSPNLELRMETGKISLEGWGGKKYEHTFELELVVKIITSIHLCTTQQCRLTNNKFIVGGGGGRKMCQIACVAVR